MRVRILTDYWPKGQKEGSVLSFSR